MLKDYFSTGDLTKPYFEVLIVSDDPTPEQVRQGRTELRQLRRPEDPFIYEAVTVPSFEEAVAAVVMNADVQAVIIKDNFRFKSQFDAPIAAQSTSSSTSPRSAARLNRRTMESRSHARSERSVPSWMSI